MAVLQGEQYLLLLDLNMHLISRTSVLIVLTGSIATFPKLEFRLRRLPCSALDQHPGIDYDHHRQQDDCRHHRRNKISITTTNTTTTTTTTPW